MSRTWKDAYEPNWKIGTDYYVNEEKLTSLEGAPSRVTGVFSVHHNLLDSLEGAPVYVGSSIDAGNNLLTSLKGVPSFIGESFFVENNRLTSLKDIHLQVKHIGDHAYFNSNPIGSHVIGLLLIDGLQGVSLDNEHVQIILNRHLPSKGIESVLEAQEELIDAGYEEYAQL